MNNSKKKIAVHSFGLIIAISLAGAFFSYLGAAPGMENLFRALMMIVSLSTAIVAFRALVTVKSNESDKRLTANRQFHDIRISEVCK